MGVCYSWGERGDPWDVASEPSARRGAAEGGQQNLVPFLDLRAVTF